MLDMTKKSSGLLSGRTRNLARHHMPSATSIRDYIKDFQIGERVAIVPKGNFGNIPHPRYKGKIGEVVERRGKAYVVQIKVMNATRKLVVPAVHLEKAQ
ncbi:MAG: Ribosomal protein L21e [Candidatus Micrarchaeum acidiphilum ARMAN-2]|uniref:Ribosomal protein L21e n=1 Tax=Candidatus Micrarchaeum acidiphilum ARMAN-2 TaxID=425595 RepID=C7DGJ2_MICA2|nr:MAG: Ribosomal protein L21e [Candidatus Micrarchaeum acidiphilum ARMAN-2]